MGGSWLTDDREVAVAEGEDVGGHSLTEEGCLR